MASLSFNVRWEGFDDIAQAIAQSASKSETILANHIMKDTRPYVPALTGRLDDGTKIDGKMNYDTRTAGNQIIYPGPQARYLYGGKLYIDPETGSSYSRKGHKKVPTSTALVYNKGMHKMAQDHWFEASKAQNLDKWVRVADKAVKHEL